ncbi:hypothetical protein D3C81_807510 [compost metagenome]
MRGGTGDGPGKAEDLVRLERGGAIDGSEVGAPAGQGAGLVEEQGVRDGQTLERAAALDKHPPFGTTGHPRNDRSGYRQDQGARRCNHEYSETPQRIAGPDPARGRQQHRDGHEGHGVAVREPRPRAALLLGGFHHPDDACEGAVFSGGTGDHFDGRARVQHAAADCLARRPFPDCGLAGQGGLVKVGRMAERAVDRDDFTMPDHQLVANAYVSEVDVLPLLPVEPVRALRRVGEQCGDLPLRARLRVRLQHAPAGQHERNDGRNQRFAEPECEANGEEGEQIDPGLPSQQRSCAVDEQGEDIRGNAADPDPASEVRIAELAGRPAAKESQC